MKIQRDGKEYTLTAEEVMEAHEEFPVLWLPNWKIHMMYHINIRKISQKRHMICMLTAVFIPNMIASNVLQRTIRIAVKNLLLQ